MLRLRLGHMFNVAIRWELIARNYATQLKPARQNPPRVRWLSPEQRASLLAHANPRLRLYILTTAYTAGRAGLCATCASATSIWQRAQLPSGGPRTVTT
jgi:hypothetical protein